MPRGTTLHSFSRLPLLLLGLWSGHAGGYADIIGTNPPAQRVSAPRIAALPASQQSAWRTYLERSERQRQADKDFLLRELAAHQLAQTRVPLTGSARTRVPLHQPAEWYRSEEARRLADNVISFQTPAGGWSKNLNLWDHARYPGEQFGHGNVSRFPSEDDYDETARLDWNYVGTFDNGATTTELRFLAKVISAVGPRAGARPREAFRRGLAYILAAQYPNGGWPQVWPLQGGYHDAIAYNDGAMVEVVRLLSDVAAAEGEFKFVRRSWRGDARRSLNRALQCILATQVIVNGQRTIWGQQHDALTLRPTSARNYEMPALCAPESAGILLFLMDQPKPGRDVQAAVHNAAAWLRQNAVRDVVYRSAGGGERRLVPAPGSGPLWPRYAEIGSNRPIFGERDKTIHNELDDISPERRIGYVWFSDAPRAALERYAVWSRTFPPMEAAASQAE